MTHKSAPISTGFYASRTRQSSPRVSRNLIARMCPRVADLRVSRAIGRVSMASIVSPFDANRSANPRTSRAGCELRSREPAASIGARCRRPHTMRAGKNLRCAGIGGFVAHVRASNARSCRDKRSNASVREIVASMPAPFAIMPTNIAKTPEFVSLEVRRTGVDMRLLSASESRACVVEYAFYSAVN
jgi:hypothetical protein